jgi:septal ring factor EnvC (AmiA/AmiB activator)
MSVMTQQILFDRVRYTDKLRESGIDEKTARAHAEALDGVLRDGVVTQSIFKEQMALMATQADVDKRFDAVDKRFADVDKRFAEVDKRFDAIDRRFDQVDARMDRLEAKIDAVEIRFDAKLDKLEAKVMTAIYDSKQQLTWLIVGALVLQFASKLVK